MMKMRASICLPILGAVLFLTVGIDRLLECRKDSQQAAQNTLLQQAIAEADAIEDNRAAVEAYARISPTIPEVQLRILQRQWLVALELLHQVQLAKYNRLLEDEVPELYAELEDHLDSMKERCGIVLTDSGPVRKEVAWRVYNLEGAARLLGAFAVLETERNWKKVESALAAAISGFKSAIEAVDESQASSLEKSIPRWNLELLHADIYVKRLKVVQPDTERLDLRDNLEAVIPEKGGYAPGEPLERRILK
jgi:hypothetical protein